MECSLHALLSVNRTAIGETTVEGGAWLTALGFGLLWALGFTMVEPTDVCDVWPAAFATEEVTCDGSAWVALSALRVMAEG